MKYIDKCQCLEMKTEGTTFNSDDIFYVYDVSKKQEYIKFHKKIKITIALSRAEIVPSSEHPPATPQKSQVSQHHRVEYKVPSSRFRILVVGKVNVGKTALINHAFGVEPAFVLHDNIGEASIDHELISSQNDRFILHESKGFEAGSAGRLEIVRDFIEHRRNMSPEHQLHAIWLCIEIPRAGQRLHEGREEFFKLKRKGTLGNVPLIVVFTKYDILVDRVERTLDKTFLDGLSDEAIKELVNNRAEAELQDICIRPLQKFAGPDIPHVTISTKEDYKGTLTNLIQLTEYCAGQYLASEVAMMTLIAQRADLGLKIRASIGVGKRRYWKVLLSCTIFMKHKICECLHVLHTDIVEVWNFNDAHRYLHSEAFRTVMMKMVEVGPTRTYRHFSLDGSVLQRFMSYTVHLTLVLQTLFLVLPTGPLTLRVIKLTVNSYLASPMSEQVSIRVQDCNRPLTILERMDRDTLDRLVEVMQFYRIDETRVSELREIIRPAGLLLDGPSDIEEW
ncbi:uncharacterized protein EDB93DRAFT_1116177 [Suillus bovinus]|uniref:uncharacterized protein n=1 Tax=Suillus bovinus TaxID=48563 RepID=UPI001B872C2B|nr:uncharacterized protein EDB93DRAFT_1116177 [Suillus bovinus]KAG2159537.1 hypothetical protein EDB93DRAFT_1116177 [Suillus bovinus]